MPDRPGPLAGRTVIDLTSALAGPYATLLLAGLGARVVKVENPLAGGDPSRDNSPYAGERGLTVGRTGAADMSVSMLVRGRNKLSVTLNLKHPAGREVFGDLVRHADVVVENFSAGVTQRLGIDHAFAAAVNPRIVYTSISGFGAQGGGPGAGKAMDTIIQALSGVMMTAGAPGEAPVRFGLPVAGRPRRRAPVARRPGDRRTGRHRRRVRRAAAGVHVRPVPERRRRGDGHHPPGLAHLQPRAAGRRRRGRQGAEPGAVRDRA